MDLSKFKEAFGKMDYDAKKSSGVKNDDNFAYVKK